MNTLKGMFLRVSAMRKIKKELEQRLSRSTRADDMHSASWTNGFFVFVILFRIKRLDESKTAAENMASIFSHINTFGYFVGMEIKNDWHLSSRSKFTLFVIVSVLWLLCYTACTEFPSVDCVVLLAGLAILSMVRNNRSISAWMKFIYIFRHRAMRNFNRTLATSESFYQSRNSSSKCTAKICWTIKSSSFQPWHTKYCGTVITFSRVYFSL